MISIIICSIDDRKFEQISRSYTMLMGEAPFEIIGIRDAKSLAEGYNRGIRQSTGSVCIFSHDDITILSPDFLPKLLKHLKSYDIVGPAGTTKVVSGFWPAAGDAYLRGQITHANQGAFNYRVTLFDSGRAAMAGQPIAGEIQALDGVFFAMHRRVLDLVQFDEKNFDGFHGYDIDFTYSAYLAGFKLAAFCDIAIIHESAGKFDLIWQSYSDIFSSKHRDSLPLMPEALSSSPLEFVIGIDCKDEATVLAASGISVQKQFGKQVAAERKRAEKATMQSSSRWQFWRMIFRAFFSRN